jgi:serine protease Do
MNKNFSMILIIAVLVGSVFGAFAGYLASEVSESGLFAQEDGRIEDLLEPERKVISIEEESATVQAVERVNPSVISIIVTKDLPVIERYQPAPGSNFFQQFWGGDFGEFFGFDSRQFEQRGTTQKQEVGGGSGFIISSDGYIVTNKHVVEDQGANYTVLTNDGEKHAARVLARDPVGDLAVLKIDKTDLPSVELGDSSTLKVGQTVIAIGNALGEFRNTVSKGVVSGLARSVVAGGLGQTDEELMGVIQTDAAINSGNSGGPLINLAGQVIGINTAMAVGAQNIGFAIPINDVKEVIESVRLHGRIIRPWLGVSYVLINDAIAQASNLEVGHGALIVQGDQSADPAVTPGSPADQAGLQKDDVILEINGQRIDQEHPLAAEIMKYGPGEKIKLKYLRGGEEREAEAQLREMP